MAPVWKTPNMNVPTCWGGQGAGFAVGCVQLREPAGGPFKGYWCVDAYPFQGTCGVLDVSTSPHVYRMNWPHGNYGVEWDYGYCVCQAPPPTPPPTLSPTATPTAPTTPVPSAVPTAFTGPATFEPGNTACQQCVEAVHGCATYLFTACESGELPGCQHMEIGENCVGFPAAWTNSIQQWGAHLNPESCSYWSTALSIPNPAVWTPTVEYAARWPTALNTMSTRCNHTTVAPTTPTFVPTTHPTYIPHPTLHPGPTPTMQPTTWPTD
jgi:hypothetical protein